MKSIFTTLKILKIQYNHQTPLGLASQSQNTNQHTSNKNSNLTSCKEQLKIKIFRNHSIKIANKLKYLHRFIFIQIKNYTYLSRIIRLLIQKRKLNDIINNLMKYQKIMLPKNQFSSSVNYSLHQQLTRQRILEIQRLGVGPVAIYHLDNTQLYQIVCDPIVQESLYNKFKIGLFSVPWQIRNGINGKMYCRVKLVERDNIFFINSNKQILNGPRFSYILVPTNQSISMSQKNLNMNKIKPEFRQFILGKTLELYPNPIDINLNQLPKHLNQSQRNAILGALRMPFSIIQGPPGTGKTVCIVTLAELLIKKGLKVMICGPSNVSAILICRLLLKNKINPKKIAMLLSNRIKEQIEVPDLDTVDLEHKVLQVAKNKSNQYPYTQFLQQFIKFIQGEDIFNVPFNNRLNAILGQLFSTTQIVCCTTVASGKRAFSQFCPDVVIIDEAGQSSEADSLIPLNKASISKIVLVGDHYQLSPTCISQNVKLQESLLAKIGLRCPQLIYFLDTQYRMHPVIGQFSSRQFYQNKLKHGTNASERESNHSFFSSQPLVIIDHNQEEKRHQKSYYNQEQINIIKQIVDTFDQQQLKNVGVLTAFKPQEKVLQYVLSQKIAQGLEVKILDGYQGSQKDYIIISFVRSNPRRDIGFLRNSGRTNVALTRAKKGLIVVGNKDTMRSDDQGNYNPWKKLVQYEQGLPREQLILKPLEISFDEVSSNPISISQLCIGLSSQQQIQEENEFPQLCENQSISELVEILPNVEDIQLQKPVPVVKQDEEPKKQSKKSKKRKWEQVSPGENQFFRY